MIPADERLRELMADHIDEHDLIANLGAFARRMHFMKAFAHYEVFRKVQDLPGDIVECGVYKGASLLSFARFLLSMKPPPRPQRARVRRRALGASDALQGGSDERHQLAAVIRLQEAQGFGT